jgi:TonB family protein
MSAIVFSLAFAGLIAAAPPTAAPERVRCPETPTAYDANPGLPASHQEINDGAVVRLRILIDPEGRVVDAQVVESTDPAFNGPSIAAVRKWKYRKHEVHDDLACIVAIVEVKFEPGS